MLEKGLYEARGVSSTKEDVHGAIKNLDKGLFPGAFCKILPDCLTGDPDYCLVMHADGAGTKTILAYLAHKEFPEEEREKIWAGIAQDSLVMNFDDVGCVGGLGPFLVSSTIGRNKFLIPGEIIAAIMEGCENFLDTLRQFGIQCFNAGGETADIGDLVRTLVVDNTIICRMKRKDVIDASRMEPGDVIVGFSSTGQAKWETRPNSGIGSNGFTNARHDILSPTYYKLYPEIVCPEMKRELAYRGKYGELKQELPGFKQLITVADALLSPTRTYLPLIRVLIARLGVENLHGLVHCSGGGQTKIGKFGQSGNRYIKDNLFPVPPLFRALKRATGMTWNEMHSVYNMGHRLEAVVPKKKIRTCFAVARECDIAARVVGYVVEKGDNAGREVILNTEHGTFTY